jgi:nucleotide-binding universal stress UspA family protein
MRILVAYDGSPAANAAIDHVLVRPWPEGTQIRVLTVIETPMFYPTAVGIEGYPPLSEEVRQSILENARHSLQAAVEKLKAKSGIVPSCELREGDVKQVLLKTIREWNCDLVVVGSHGKKALDRLFLGSVSHALVTHAPCDVEIVRPRRQAA